jgi:hypothetical protein
MNQFVQRILNELKTNESLKKELLVQVLTESIDKSIALNENNSSIYNSLKVGVVSINQKLKNPVLESIILQFAKNEDTPEAKVQRLANEVNFAKTVELLKESAAYSNPIIKTQIDGLEKAVTTGTPGFALCLPFINVFEQYAYDKTIKSCLESVKSYVSKNRAKLSVISTIYALDEMNSPIYAGASTDLKSMLLSESYSADILKLKYSTSIPLVSNLINDLRIIESQETGSFTLGEGNGDTRVNNLIAPAIKTKDGLIMYIDNRFLSIRESKGLTGDESKVHIDENFKISDLNPNFVKTNYGVFYNLCESYVTLGFTKTSDGLGVETSTIKNFKLGLRTNENKEIDFYINDNKIDQVNESVMSEALALQPTQVKEKVNAIVENTKNIFNFEFIKEVTNDRTLSESLIFNLNESYYVCDKLNAAERDWKKVDENELYQFIASKFNYDVSKIFKVKIDEATAVNKEIEEQKKTILENISKLEASVEKLDEASRNPNLDESETKYFIDLKENINSTISKLKEKYIAIDLLKKK